MASTATTQSISNGQIGQICDRLATQLRGSDLPLDKIQLMLSAPGGMFIDRMADVIRKRVEFLNNGIVHRVKVNRKRKAIKVIHDTGFEEHIEIEAVNTMPQVNAELVDLWYLPLGEDMTSTDFNLMLSEFGFAPDPFAQAVDNAANKEFVLGHPNCTQWKDAAGRICHLAFHVWDGKRGVSCEYDNSNWAPFWWGCGGRKVNVLLT